MMTWKHAALFMVVLTGALMISAGHAHDGMHDDWLKGLTNGNKIACCDGSEAFSVLDPDWDIAQGHYRVRQSQQHQWLVIQDSEVVTESNKIGIAKVWPTMDASGTWTSVRCFLPGSGG